LSKALRKINAVVSKTDTTIIFINQLREKIGVMFGNPETTTGGRALKFYSSVRLDVRKVDTIKQGGDITGNRVKVKVVKNKMAPPMKEAQFDLMFDSGASQTGALVDFGVELGIIEKSGSWFSYQDAKIGQGRENAKLYLEENPDVAQIIEQQIYEHYGIVDNKDIDPSVMEEAKARIKEETEQFDFDSDDM
jgi:recombination protein RecA